MVIEQISASEWPTGQNSPLLILPLEPEDLSRMFGLVFVDRVDDLGELKLAVVRGVGYGIAGLIKYRDAPFEGTTVYVDSKGDLGSVCDAILREFGLSRSEISWITTEL